MKSSLESLSRRVRATRCATVSPTKRRRRRLRRQHHHPVEQIQNGSNPYVLSEQKKNHLANVYGIALPAQMDIERQILQHVERLPNNHTLKSKRVGLEILSGNVDRMDFSDYLGQSDLAPEARTNKTTHEIMEHRLGLGLTGPKGK